MSTVSSPASSLSSGTDPELSPTTQRTIPTLLGKSTFKKWHAAINSILLSNEEARFILSGIWTEPPSPQSPDPQSTTSSASPVTPVSADSQSRLYTFLHASSLSGASRSVQQLAHREYEQANVTVCRFIRGTLAINVIPFVRQQVNAKALYEQLIYLYGEKGGIDMVGGPAVFGAINSLLSGRRTTEASISRILEEHDTSPILTDAAETNPAQDSRRTNDSGLGYGTNMTMSRASDTTSSRSPIHDPSRKKKKPVAFKFTNTFPFRRSGNESLAVSSSTTILSPIAQSPSPASATAATGIPLPLTSGESSTSISGSTCKASTASINTVSDPDFDFSYTAQWKASAEEDEGTQVEMRRSTAATPDFETPMEEREDYSW